jgi:hypothetical protein
VLTAAAPCGAASNRAEVAPDSRRNEFGQLIFASTGIDRRFMQMLGSQRQAHFQEPLAMARGSVGFGKHMAGRHT